MATNEEKVRAWLEYRAKQLNLPKGWYPLPFGCYSSLEGAVHAWTHLGGNDGS